MPRARALGRGPRARVAPCWAPCLARRPAARPGGGAVWGAAPAGCRGLWTPEGGYRPRRDDPRKRPALELRGSAEARLRRGHPWVYPREVVNANAVGHLSPCLVNLVVPSGDVLGVALYNRHSSVAARVLSEEPFVQIDANFFAERLRRSLGYRERLFSEPFYRAAHAEADGLPGLTVDRYGDQLCVQPTAAGLDALLWPIVDALEEVLQPKVIVIRQDALGRRQERAAVQKEVVKGQYSGPTELRENGVTFLVDLLHGQKTGWYFDHRDARARLAALAPRCPRVLDLYSYIGGFGVTLAHYGAEEVLCVDSSEAALDLCARSAALSCVDGSVHTVRADVLEFLEGGGEAGDVFDLVIVDPPNLGGDRTNAPKAIRFYERLVHAAAKRCAKHGLLFVASCTHHIGESELLGAVGRALRWQDAGGADAGGADAGAGRGPARAARAARLVAVCGQAADHPGHLQLPESRYLTSLLLQLD